MRKNNLKDLIESGCDIIKATGSYIDIKTALSIYDKNKLYKIKESDKCREWIIYKN